MKQKTELQTLVSLLCAACNFERQRVKAFVHQLCRRSFTVCCWNSADFEQFQHLSSPCNLCLPKGQTVWPLEFSADFLQSTNYGIAHQTRISHRLLQIYGEDSVVSQACKACLCCKAAELSWKLRLAVWPKVFFHWFLRLKLRFHGSSVYIFVVPLLRCLSYELSISTEDFWHLNVQRPFPSSFGGSQKGTQHLFLPCFFVTSTGDRVLDAKKCRFCSQSVSLDEKAGLGGTRTNVGSWGSSSRGIRARKLTPAKAMAVMEPQDMRTGFEWFDGKW